MRARLRPTTRTRPDGRSSPSRTLDCLERGHELGRRRGLGEAGERARDIARCAPGIEPERGLRVRLDAGVEPERRGRRALQDLRERRGGIVRLAQLVDRRERPQALLAQELVDVGGLAPALPADAAVPLVDARPGKPRGGRAEPREQLVATAPQPGVATEPRDRVSHRRLRQGCPRVERVGDVERRERCRERPVRGVSRRQHDQQVVGRDAGPQGASGLGSDRTRLAGGTGDLEQPDTAIGCGRGLRPPRGEEAALERDQGVALDVAARAELDVLVGARGEALEGRGRRSEGLAAGLERQGDGRRRTGGDRLDERALRGPQLLEAVHEQRRVSPGCKLPGDAPARFRDPRGAIERAAFGALARPCRHQLGDGAWPGRRADGGELALELQAGRCPPRRTRRRAGRRRRRTRACAQMRRAPAAPRVLPAVAGRAPARVARALRAPRRYGRGCVRRARRTSSRRRRAAPPRAR